MSTTPRYVPPAVEPATYGPLTRAATAVETAVARGYGGRVADDEMAGPAPTRNAFVTAVLARQGWTTWLPGDGSSYQAHLVTITIGPDRADLVLLLNIGRRTVAFQFPTPDYRKRETGPWTRKKAREQGIPRDLWDAAKPLLAVLGATRKTAKTAPWPTAVIDVHLPTEDGAR